MEITCTRCHQAVQADNCYCPACGLPQLIYSAEGVPGQAPAEQGNEAVRDASSVDWKPALRAALMLAVPAGLLSSEASPVGRFGLFWMTAAAAWAVVLYLRSQQSAWITIGAGARIGLVTGLLGGWMAFCGSGCALFVERFILHQSSQIDAAWKAYVEASQQLTAQIGLGDAAQMQTQAAWMLSSWGHAGFVAFGFAFNSVFLLLFAVAGGALGARLMARNRRPEV
ncbi:MAG TPA: hypothetical protein VKG86_04405 [Terracidiphilus sp.]|nr:hypothetical protein [Terracidiphilus sp.]